MTTTVRTTPAGRFIVETDGYDKLWNAVIQGALVCKVSLPASVELEEDDYGWSGIDPVMMGEREPLWMILQRAINRELPGARVFYHRRIM